MVFTLAPTTPRPAVGRLGLVFSWIAALLVAFVFLSNEKYKLMAHPSAVMLFTVLSDWMHIAGHEQAYRLFTAACEITASLLLLWPRARIYGALFTVAIMTVALLSLVLSPLTTDPYHDGSMLFITTWVVWLAGLLILAIHRREVFAAWQLATTH